LFALTASPTSQPVRYQQLASALGVELGGRAAALDVRAAVLGLRAAKGMLIDARCSSIAALCARTSDFSVP